MFCNSDESDMTVTVSEGNDGLCAVPAMLWAYANNIFTANTPSTEGVFYNSWWL